MNYWLLTTEYPPFFGGGISTYCYHTACMLTEKGHQVTVFINDRSVQACIVEKKKEARVIRFNPDTIDTRYILGNVAHLSYAFAMMVKQFILSDGRPDVIEAQDYNGIGYFLLQFKYCLSDWCINIPVVITMHSPAFLYMEYNQIPLYKRPNYWIGEMERFSIQAADLLISPSHYLVKELEKRFKINNTNLHVLVNPFRFDSKDALLQDCIHNNELTFYGKLSPQKGTFKILELFQKLWEGGFQGTFTMIGEQGIVFHPEGKTMGQLVREKYVRYLKKGVLKLKREIAPAERAQLLKNALLFVVPSIVDNLPYVVLELMSLGKIVIVSKQGGQAEIVTEGKNGFIFNYDEPESFEEKLTSVLKLTSEERKTIAACAIKTVQEKFSYETVYAGKRKLLENIRSGYQIPRTFPLIRKLAINNSTYTATYPDNARLSVVIPYYNLGRYLEQAVASVLNSSYTNMEILIVNDGSTEQESIEKLNLYRSHEQVKVIDKVNTGLADTRNIGAEAATGTFLAFLDADDEVANTYYEKAVRILSHYENVHFVGAWTRYFEGSQSIWPTFNPEPPLILVHNMINSSSLVYKRSAYLASGTNNREFSKGLEDYESVIHMKACGLNGVAIPEILFHYRVRKNSMIKGVDSNVRKDYHERIKVLHPWLFMSFNKETDALIELNGPPLTTDNDTLDDLPFQNIPVLNRLIRKCIQLAKTHPTLKKMALLIKKSLRR